MKVETSIAVLVCTCGGDGFECPSGTYDGSNLRLGELITCGACGRVWKIVRQPRPARMLRLVSGPEHRGA